MYSNSREVTFSCVFGACTASLWNMRKGIASQLPWWRHQMETLSTLLAFCARNSPVTGEFPTGALCFLWSAPEPRVEQTNGDTGNLRRHRAHYDVMVMHRFWVTKEISSVRRSLNHWNGNVFILMKFSSLAALKVVKMTTSSAASDENFVKMTTFSFQWIKIATDADVIFKCIYWEKYINF